MGVGCDWTCLLLRPAEAMRCWIRRNTPQDWFALRWVPPHSPYRWLGGGGFCVLQQAVIPPLAPRWTTQLTHFRGIHYGLFVTLLMGRSCIDFIFSREYV